MFRTLDPGKIIDTLRRLGRRIDERFPGAGLSRVCAELTTIAEQAQARSREIARPAIGLRIGAAAVVLAGSALMGLLAWHLLAAKKTSDDLFGTLQGVDSAFNIIVLMGAALYFMFSLEERWKRRRVLHAPLRVERRDRLGPRALALACVHHAHEEVRRSSLQHSAHHLAAIVRFRHNRIRAKRARQFRNARRPDMRRTFEASIRKHRGGAR